MNLHTGFDTQKGHSMKKTICELFAGVGGFRLGFDRLDSGWETTWFSQWEPGKKKQWAHDCYVKHFGDSPDMNGELHTGEDISTIKKENIPDHTLLVGGFPCLAGNTLVLTSRGLIPISDITTEDKVFSHDGALHSVVNVFDQGVKPTFQISGYAFDEIIATGNHRFYVRTREYSFPTIDGKKQKIKSFTPPKWVFVQDMLELKPKDIYFGNKINTDEIIPKWDGLEVYINKTIKKTLCTLDMSDGLLWYLAGRFLGDGWLRKQQKKGKKRYPYNGIIICCNKDESNLFEQRVGERFHYTKVEDRTVNKYIFSNIELAAFMSQFGVGADNKCLPYFVHSLPKNLLQQFVDGYFDSDGCKINNKLQFTTISRKLAYDIASVLEKVYQRPCQIYLTKMKKKTEIEGRIVNQKDFYIVRCVLESVHHSAFYEEGYIWYPIKDITPAGERHVYDIEVEGTHSFTANRAITHNCQDYSVAHSLSSSKGIEGKKGVLWWQIRDTIIAKKPPFILLENVDRLLKSPASQRGRDFGMILTCFTQLGYDAEWRVVNAADYGAGQRRRRVFIFAYSQETEYGKRTASVPIENIILNDGLMAKAFPIKQEELKINTTAVPMSIDLEESEQLIEISEKFAFPFEVGGYLKQGKIHTCSVNSVFEKPTLLGELLQSADDDDLFLVTDKLKKWIDAKGSKRIPRKSANGHEYTFSEGPVAFPDPWDRPGRTMLTSESTLNRSSHVVSDPGTGMLRILTPIEAERLQGFDDDWTKTCLVDGENVPMPNRMRYFCMGNALVVPMITRMGEVLDGIIEREK